MKKTVLAIAAAASVGTGFAQSNVAIGGRVDVPYQILDNKGTGRISRVHSGGMGVSLLYIRGQEDLGGGLSAGFWLEGQFAADTGVGSVSNTNNQASGTSTSPAGTQGFMFNRRATVSLVSKTLGELRLGRAASLQSLNMYFYDPFLSAGIGAAQPFLSMITGATANRTSNTIDYSLPANLGGVFGSIAYYLGENPSSATTAGASTRKDGTGVGLRVGYRAGPLDVAIAYGGTNYAAGDTVQSSVGGAYDFGVARLMANLERDKNGTTQARGWVIGTIVPVWQVGEIKVALSDYDIETPGLVDARSRKLALGYVHNLSKRTSLYTTVSQVRNKGRAASALAMATPGPSAGLNARGFEAGLRHVF